MISLSLSTIVLSTLEIMILGAVGYFLYKFRGIKDEGLDTLTKLVINIFLPCLTAKQFLFSFSFGANPNWWIFPLIGIWIFLLGLLISKVFCFLFKLKFQNEFTALISFQNSGYLPLIMVTTLFAGEVADKLYLNIFLLLTSFNITIWTFGVYLITGRSIKTVGWRSLFNMPLMTILFCLFMVSTGLSKFVPLVLLKSIDMLGACTLPLIMIVIGGNLAKVKIGAVSKEVVIAVLSKLVLMPAIGLLIVYLARPEFYISFIIMIQTMMPAATTSSIIVRHYKSEEHILNQGIFYTHLLCMITVPFFLYVYSIMVGKF